MAKPGKTGLARVIDATGYSLKGLRAAWTHESAFRQESLLALVLIPIAFWIADTLTQVALLVAVTLAVVPLKKDRSEWLVEKATELGVARIVFFDCARSVANPSQRRRERGRGRGRGRGCGRVCAANTTSVGNPATCDMTSRIDQTSNV